MQLSLANIDTEKDLASLAHLASEIWHEYFVTISGC